MTALLTAVVCAVATAIAPDPPGPPGGWPLADLVSAPWVLFEEFLAAALDPEPDAGPAPLGPQGRSYAPPYPAAGLEALAGEIRAEVDRPGRLLLIDAQAQAAAADPYPLPLAASWAKGHGINNRPVVGTVTGVPPQYQYQLLRQGRHLLPWFGAPAPSLYGTAGEDELWALNGEQQFLQTCSLLGLPIAVVQGGQWEQLFDPDPRFSGANHVPNNYFRDHPTSTGLGSISPAGTSNTPWTTLGNRAASPALGYYGDGAPSQLGAAQALYPNQGASPQRVFFLSNDEMKRVPWSAVPEYAGYSPSTAREVWGSRFRTVYGAMFGAFRGRLSPGWGARASFVSYKAFGFDGWARYGEWWKSSHHAASFGPSPFPTFWDGAAVQVFPLPGEVDRLASPLAHAMNYVFMADAALAAKPSYWQEMTVRNDDDSVPAARWGALCRHGMWLLRPRVVRVWESSAKVLVDDPAMQERLRWTLNEVDSVWADPVLNRFWRWGRLLHNDSPEGTAGPYQVDIPPAWETPRRPRWFRLTVDRYGDEADPNFPFSDAKTRTTLSRLVISNPGRTSHYGQVVDVWSLALVNGPPGRREWLVYVLSAAAALDFPNVELSLPDDAAPGRRLAFRSMVADRLGKFFHFAEGADGQPALLGEVRPPVDAPLPPFERIVRP